LLSPHFNSNQIRLMNIHPGTPRIFRLRPSLEDVLPLSSDQILNVALERNAAEMLDLAAGLHILKDLIEDDADVADLRCVLRVLPLRFVVEVVPCIFIAVRATKDESKILAVLEEGGAMDNTVVKVGVVEGGDAHVEQGEVFAGREVENETFEAVKSVAHRGKGDLAWVAVPGDADDSVPEVLAAREVLGCAELGEVADTPVFDAQDGE
jgi:hypothetical protein